MESNRQGILVVADAFDQGWRATVNGVGKFASPRTASCGPSWSPGRSHVDWTFDPPSGAAGGNSLTLASILGIAIRDRLPHRRVHPHSTSSP